MVVEKMTSSAWIKENQTLMMSYNLLYIFIIVTEWRLFLKSDMRTKFYICGVFFFHIFVIKIK
jgi:hypothetical protein